VGGIPVSVVGVAFFGVVALLATLKVAGPPEIGRHADGYILALSSAGLVVTAFFAAVSTWLLQRWCVSCIATYCSVVGAFVGASLTSTIPFSRVPHQFFLDVAHLVQRPPAVVTLLIALASAIALTKKYRSVLQAAEATHSVSVSNSARKKGALERERELFEASWRKRVRVPLGVSAESAMVVIVRFVDWQCGSCWSAYLAHAPVLAKYEQMYPGVVRAVTKDFPLSMKCNCGITVRGHTAACEAAVAVRMASERGHEKEMVNWLYVNRGTLTPRRIQIEVLNRFGIANWQEEYARFLPELERDITEALALGVRETPTYFVNGVLASRGEAPFLSPVHLDWAIRSELHLGRSTQVN
jgi:protein-disulfide isomerase